MKHVMTRATRDLSLICVAALAASLTACGLLREKERSAPVAQISSSSASCAFPTLSELTDAKKVSEAMIDRAADCIQSQVDTAFSSVHGAHEGELSIDEARELKDRGVVNFPIRSEDEWKALEGGISFLNPAGRPAISKEAANELIRWIRDTAPLYVKLIQVDREHPSVDWATANRVIDAAERLFALISPEGRMTLEQAQAAARAAVEAFPQDKDRKPIDPAVLSAQVEAAWKLKALALERSGGDSGNADLRGDALKKLLGVGIRVARGAEVSYKWFSGGGLPQDVPAGLPDEWSTLAGIVRDYFTATEFDAIDTDQLRWAVHKLSPQSSLADLVPDLVRVSQRLAPEGARHEGLHPIGFTRLLDSAAQVARDVIASAPAFGRCRTGWRCFVPLRQVYRDHPVLRRVALKGYVDDNAQYDNNGNVLPPGKRLDAPLRWEETISRLVERGMIKELFKAFDRDGDGKIPLEGNSSEDTREAMDLAYTFLRFASVSSKNPEPKHDAGVEEAPAPILIKPSALYRTIGLIGDQWMPDGNNDHALDAEEFFSVITVYQDIQTVAQITSWSGDQPMYTSDPSVPYWEVPGGPYYSRTGFIRNLHKAYRYFKVHSYQMLTSIPDETRESLFHGLIGVPDTPIDLFTVPAWNDSSPAHPVTLRQYVRSDAALAPAAVIELMDRLMILCDRDEDGELDWNELDCAMPLMVDAGLQAVSSELVDLDPGVHDLSKILLSVLGNPGMPRAIAKLIAINGAVRELHLPDGLSAWLAHGIEADWNRLARMIGAPDDATAGQLRIWAAEAERRYGSCDQNHDGRISGPEMDCLADRVLDQLERLLSQVASDHLTQGMAQDLLRALRGSELSRAAIKLATQDDAGLQQLFATIPGLRSSPSKLLNILEQSIRRSVPLCQQPGC